MAEIGKCFVPGDSFAPISEDGKVYLRARAEGDLLLPTHDAYSTFSLSCAIRLEHVEEHSDLRGYGIRFGIRANGYRELRVCHKQCLLRLIDVTDGIETELYCRPNFFFTSNDFHIFGLEVQKNEVNIWIDGALYDTVKADVIPGQAGVFLCDAGVALHGIKVE